GADLFGLSDGLTVAAGQLLDVDLDDGAAGALPLVPAREAPVSGARESVLRVEPGMTPDMMPDVTLEVLPHRAPDVAPSALPGPGPCRRGRASGRAPCPAP